MRSFGLVLALLACSRFGLAARCELLLPTGDDGADIGIIMIPGANYPGERYIPLAKKIQESIPTARVWFGITEGWLVDTPNPVEISGAINSCRSQAEEQNLGGPLYLAGHSLGGVMLEQYLQSESNVEPISGVLLYGSYLTDFILGDSNNYVVPALTVVGELDGLTLSYVYREWLESAATGSSQYPVYIAGGVNHAQVGSGDVPGFVKDRDIPAEMSDEDAHLVYAEITSSFIVLQNSDLFEASVVSAATSKAEESAAYTETFLAPFREAALLEADGDTSEWMIRGQEILTGATDADGLKVIDLVVPFSDLGDAKPSVEGQDCAATVTTYATPEYDWDAFDAGALISSSVIKAKFKLEDVVREELCLPAIQRKQCKDINEEAYKIALEMASETARQRFERMGTRLFFLDDSVSPWGPGWEYSTGLHYSSVNETHTSLYSTSLISEPDFIITVAAGMHYCDLLSPFRALEWIYITSLVGK